MRHVRRLGVILGVIALVAAGVFLAVDFSETPLRSVGSPTLLFAASANGGSWDVYAQDVESGRRTNLTRTPRTGSSDVDDRNPTLSYDAKLIAFTSTADHHADDALAEEIFVMARDGSARRRLTDDENADGPPEWAAYGGIVFTTCRFSRDDAPECRLDAVMPDGAERETTVDDLGFAFDVTRSPDGSQIAYSRYDDAGRLLGLFIRTIGLTKEQRVAAGGGARWSPDGEQLVFFSTRDRNGRCLFGDCSGHAAELYVVNADGSDQRRLTRTTATEGFASWTPDGKWVLFSRIRDEDDDYDVYAIRADGSCEVQLTDTRAWEWSPSWSGPTDALSC